MSLICVPFLGSSMVRVCFQRGGLAGDFAGDDAMLVGSAVTEWRRRRIPASR